MEIGGYKEPFVALMLCKEQSTTFTSPQIVAVFAVTSATTLSLSKPNSVVFLSLPHGASNSCTVDKRRKTPSGAHVSSAGWGEEVCTYFHWILARAI